MSVFKVYYFNMHLISKYFIMMVLARFFSSVIILIGKLLKCKHFLLGRFWANCVSNLVWSILIFILHMFIYWHFLPLNWELLDSWVYVSLAYLSQKILRLSLEMDTILRGNSGRIWTHQSIIQFFSPEILVEKYYTFSLYSIFLTIRMSRHLS